MQELARPADALPHGRLLQRERAGRLAGAAVFQTAQDERLAQTRGELGDLRIDEDLQLLPGGAQGRVAGRDGMSLLLVSALAGGGPACVGGHAMGNSVKPAGQGCLLADASRLPGQDQEGGLERILGVVRVAQRAPA
ncbi:MAG: hypothetical protein L0Z62_42355, partial [Gemmataceae bacterium]|nr:hypothetical protein [Gemmataceae bacterium]